MPLHFSDGVNVNTSGPLRTLHLSDGWYVAGQGILMPCDDRADAENVLAELVARDLTSKPKEIRQ